MVFLTRSPSINCSVFKVLISNTEKAIFSRWPSYIFSLAEHYEEMMINLMLQRQLKAREEMILRVPFVNEAYHNKVHHRGGVYVKTSDA